ncbi:hypothetical protein CA267_001820 [Alteromonas pelagimontana]|uniref:Uncharacterized protein n=1 Tax=Alteromonas pelagimontana TaxID=1858656 RepID=A0A6M4M8T9_9ALTE|nr:hypothetical protein [Alteromonas pelagimontana]QJR79621.1 hypothetical protein CA267_001820 [Alteromonas pelagimontana]
MKNGLYKLLALIGIPAAFVLGYHVGRVDRFSWVTLSDLSDLGGLLAGLAGVALAIFGFDGIDAWKKSLKAGQITRVVDEASKLLEEVVGSGFAEFISEATYHKTPLNPKDGMRATILEQKERARSHWKNVKYQYDQQRSQYNLLTSRLSALTGESLPEKAASESVAASISEVKKRALARNMNDALAPLNLQEEQKKIIADAGEGLFYFYPFNR